MVVVVVSKVTHYQLRLTAVKLLSECVIYAMTARITYLDHGARYPLDCARMQITRPRVCRCAGVTMISIHYSVRANVCECVNVWKTRPSIRRWGSK